MKKHLNLIILLFIMICFGGVYYYLINAEKQENKENFLFPTFEKVSSIKIKKGEDEFELLKNEDKWEVKNNNKSYIADDTKVQNLIDKIQSITKTEQVSINQENQITVYGFSDAEKIEVNINNNFDFQIGKNESFNRTYINIGDNRTFTVNVDLRSSLNNNYEQFRNKKVIAFEKNMVNKITIDNKIDNKKVEFNKNDDKWTDQEDNEIEIEKINNYLDSLSNLQISKFINFPENLEEYGLDDKNVNLLVDYTIDENVNAIRFGKIDDKYYMSISNNSEEIFEINGGDYEKLKGLE